MVDQPQKQVGLPIENLKMSAFPPFPLQHSLDPATRRETQTVPFSPTLIKLIPSFPSPISG